MTRANSSTRIGQQSVLVTVLAVAAIIGWGIGTWLGRMAPDAATAPNTSASPAIASPSSFQSASPSATRSPTIAPPLGTILEASGTGDQSTRSFEVLPGWQIVWHTDGERFAFAVRGDRDLGMVVDQTGPASGATSLPAAGTFHIEVTAAGPWTLTVLQGEAPATPSPS